MDANGFEGGILKSDKACAACSKTIFVGPIYFPILNGIFVITVYIKDKHGFLTFTIMNLQYITDDKGRTTGVYIPIKEWDNLRSKYQDIDKESPEVPEWHKETVRQRMDDYKNNPDQAVDFDAAMNDIEKDL